MPAGFTFSDLFAGIGGFHAALHAAGGRWAFASEIDHDAARVYDYNWLRPLRESGAPLPPGVKEFRVDGDIVELTDPVVRVPKADVLAAGFPCQPFSKSGYQRGMDETRGTLFWNIARILQNPRKRPSVVLLENVRNLAGPRHRDTTFKTIVTTLRQLGYRTASEPSVFSPHLLPPRARRPPAGPRASFHPRPLRRAPGRPGPGVLRRPDRVARSRSRTGVEQGTSGTSPSTCRSTPTTSACARRQVRAGGSELKWIQEWDRLLTVVAQRSDPRNVCPGFPIWLQHFGDFRTVDGAERYIRRLERSHGRSRPGSGRYLMKNGEWFERFADVIEPHWQVISTVSRPRDRSSSGRRARTGRWPRRSCTSGRRGSVASAPTTSRRWSPSPRRRFWGIGVGSRPARRPVFRGCPTGSSSGTSAEGARRRQPAGRGLIQADGERGQRGRRLLRLPRVRPTPPRRDPRTSPRPGRCGTRSASQPGRRLAEFRPCEMASSPARSGVVLRVPPSNHDRQFFIPAETTGEAIARIFSLTGARHQSRGEKRALVALRDALGLDVDVVRTNAVMGAHLAQELDIEWVPERTRSGTK